MPKITAIRMQNKSRGLPSDAMLSEYDHQADSYDSNYKALAHPSSIIFIKNLYDAYVHVMTVKGITPMTYDDIHEIFHHITYIDHTRKKKSIINHIQIGQSNYTNIVLTMSKYNRISFIQGLYDSYISIKNPLWIYTEQNKFTISKFTLIILSLQLIEIAAIVLVVLLKCRNYPIYLIIARASSVMILLNSFFLLVHISNITQYIDNRLIRKITTNSSGFFHKLFGFKILLGGLIHTIGHILHIDHVLSLCKTGCNIDSVHTVPNNTIRLVISWKYFLSQPTYYTGIILVGLCIFTGLIILIQKLSIIRIATFYNVHKVSALLFFIIIIWHGVQQLLGFNLSYIFVLPMLLVYMYTRRFETLTQTLQISKWHITDTMIRLYVINSSELIHQLDRCIALSVYVNHPGVSKYEWHPFTLTFGINKYEGSFNIKSTGKWTKAFVNRILKDSNHHIVQYINIGHVTQSCFRFYKFYTTRIFFCSGIGITPFLTVMNNIINNKINSNDIFVWSIGDIELIKEFQTIINTLIKRHKLQIFIFYSNSAKQSNTIITSANWHKYNFLQTLIHYYTDIDIVHGVTLPMITILERINPTSIISRIINQCDSGTNIGVFVCGGASYANAIDESVSIMQNNKKNITLDLWIEHV